MKRSPAFLLILTLFSSSFTSAQTLQHECGIAFIRLFKPIAHYRQKYHDAAWGLHKVCLLMEKQRNRGQDNVGISTMQFDMPPGQSYLRRVRSADRNALEDLFATIDKRLRPLSEISPEENDFVLKQQCNLIGEIYLGHVRYATYAGRAIEFCQPCVYKNSIPAKCLSLAGNFNMTNSSAIMKEILSYGLAASSRADTHLLMHHVSYWIDKAYEYSKAKALQEGYTPAQAAELASNNLDVVYALRRAASHWDGGYVFAGILGNGDSFICRDPAGIRPGYYYMNDELFAAASERSAITNVLSVAPDEVKEIPPAHVLIIKKDGSVEPHRFTQELPLRRCVFERIYFSRANDPDIYQERKRLGNNLASRLFEELGKDVSHSVFSYIPNTSEISFCGLVEKLNQLVFDHAYDQLKASGTEITDQEIKELMRRHANVEKLIFKDQAIRTFIAHEEIRSNLASSVYDVTRGVASDQDTLIAVDDSVVRGTTLRESIIKQLIQLNPKKIIIVSAAPLIMYPDCYGIDMSLFGRLIAFQAAVALTKDRGNKPFLDELYQECVSLKKTGQPISYNPVKKLYDQFTQQEIEQKVAELVYPHQSNWKNELQVIYQSVEGMQQAIPEYTGDWYFTGNYPTAGGNAVVVNSYINWYTASTTRAY